MASLTLLLPARLDGPSLFALTQKFIDGSKAGLPQYLIFDFAVLAFVEPAGVTFLSNFIRWLGNLHIEFEFINHTRGVYPLQFLDDSLFFERHLGAKLRPDAAPRSTTKVLYDLTNDRSHTWLRMHLMPWLAAKLTTNEASLSPFQVVASEMFNNIKDHSTRDIGSVFVQHFPQRKRVCMAIADFGRGIPSLVRDVIPGISDEAAILQAVQPGFTTRSTPGNRGAGLDYLLQTVVRENEGSVTIYSRRRYVAFTPSLGGIDHASPETDGFCPGTTIDINFRTDRIVQVPDEGEDLEW